MTRFWTHYWSNPTWDANRDELQGKPCDGIWGSALERTTMEAGDVIYIVTVNKGRLFVAGKIRAFEFYVADQGLEIDADQSTSFDFDIEIPLQITRKLEFISGAGRTHLKFEDKDSQRLDRQTLRPCRQLTLESALLLDEFLPPLEDIEFPDSDDSDSRPLELTNSSGGGFGSWERNQQIEQAAVEYVTRLYEGRGWNVRSVEAEKVGYDLMCTFEDQEEHVEVKGSSGNEETFILTANEYKQSKSDPKFHLILVKQVLDTDHIAYRSWTGDELHQNFNFEPISFKVTRK